MLEQNDTGLKSGDRCPACEQGFIRVYSNHRRGGLVVQYLDCDNKECTFKTRRAVDGSLIRRRKKKQEPV